MNREFGEFDRGEVQDRLPDLVHGTLPDAERAIVERAVTGDPELARELQAIRDARGALTPRVKAANTERIVSAIGRPMPARRGLGVARWRVAAAIATIAVGAASLGIVQSAFRGEAIDPLTIVGESTLVATADSLSISFGYDLSGMSAAELEKLFADLEKSGGLPSTEPRTTVVTPPVEELQ